MTTQVLDCTLRDGGFSVNFEFGEKVIVDTIKNLASANIDIIELGYLNSSVQNNKNTTLFPSLHDALELKKDYPNSLFSIMIQYPDFDASLLPENNGFIDLIRICPRYSELNNSLEFMKMVGDKGYKISIQPAITARYKEEELEEVFKTANDIKAFSVYIVDTFGYLEESSIESLFDKFNYNLNEDIKIGFHGHNNTSMAFSNSKFFTSLTDKRNIVIDSTLSGIGQGPGNLQTELFTFWMNENMGKTYSTNRILDAVENIVKFNSKTLWGYSIVDLIGALTKTSYKYAHYYKDNYNFSFSKIFDICKTIPEEDDMKARFNKENAEIVLKNFSS